MLPCPLKGSCGPVAVPFEASDHAVLLVSASHVIAAAERAGNSSYHRCQQCSEAIVSSLYIVFEDRGLNPEVISVSFPTDTSCPAAGMGLSYASFSGTAAGDLHVSASKTSFSRVLSSRQGSLHVLSCRHQNLQYVQLHSGHSAELLPAKLTFSAHGPVKAQNGRLDIFQTLLWEVRGFSPLRCQNPNDGGC